MITQSIHAIGESSIIGCDHAAFASRDRLAWMKREGSRNPEAARRYALVARSSRTGRVFDDRHMSGQNGAQGIHVRAKSEEMNCYDRLGLTSDPARYLCWIDIECS